ncbi:cytochrome c oxidase assembly protein [Ferrovibrio terrae]|uniref:cytochrome c oxidase assembly protein n=1 Tax=Ferrovibrio terrae TaxID=2594003 RepID=UPI003138286A
MSARRDSLQARNRRIALYCVSTVAVMIAGAFASAPLYDMFCRVTGFAGTPLRATAAPGVTDPNETLVTVRFNSDVAPGMPWKFQPVQREMKVRPGEETLAFYRAINPTARPVMGTASFNVTPEKAGQYFNKIACFCFTEQLLGPGESVDMPVSFFVDPEILKDPKTRDVLDITLSYTFFRKEDPTRVSDRGGAARPVN